MLATLSGVTDQPGMVYEFKWDGYRAIMMKNGKTLQLLSRNDKTYNTKFYPVYAALQNWDINAIVDGEIVVIDESGKPAFGALQNWRSEADGQLLYYVFDVMWYKGHDLNGVPLVQRRQLLESLMEGTDPIIRFSESLDAHPVKLIEAVKKMGMEGIMAKRADSLYHPGLRTKDWLKMKAAIRHEVVIGGFTQNEGTVKSFSSLLVGVHKKGKLQYIGKVGTGFSTRTQQDILKQMMPLVRKTNPFGTPVDVNKPSRFRPGPLNAKVIWLKPELVAEVTYAELTADGVMRHPSFAGMREDKKAGDVMEEKQIAIKASKITSMKNTIMPNPGMTQKTLLNLMDNTQSKKVNGKELKFSNVQKLYWKKEKITKGDLINYYHQVAPIMLPYLTGRPHSLNRHPDGWDGKSFYQKDVTGKAPEWMATFPYRSADENVDKEFLVVEDEASLLFMVNLGCIEINPWSSTTKKPDHPTWCVLDLDPDNNRFDTVIQAARVGYEILTAAGIPSYCKTSGSTGLHIYIPLNGKYNYDQSKEFARVIVTMMQNEMPDSTSIERVTTKRKGKIYLDFLQNRPQATLAAPYSVRPKPGATVSMPLHWEEVKKGLKMTDFQIGNVVAQLKERGDLFKGVMGKGIDMQKAMKELERLYSMKS
jgi:bifunctional non-homologous end joining protein LigD